MDWKVIIAIAVVVILVYATIRDPKMIYHFIGWIDQLVSKVGTIGGK